jgi:hypothetical protein
MFNNPINVFMLACVVIALGCGESYTSPPTGLTKPPPSAFAALEEEKFKIRDVVATITLPKDNPKLTGKEEIDAGIKRSLPKLKCQVEFSIDPMPVEGERFEIGITITVPKGDRQIVHSTGPGSAKVTERGKVIADIELFQSRPLDSKGKANISLRVQRYSPGSTRAIEVDNSVGKVNFKVEVPVQ